MDTIDRPGILFLVFFPIIFSLLTFEEFGFGGHIIFSYCNLLYVGLFLFLTRNSRRARLRLWLCSSQPYIRLLSSGSHGKEEKKNASGQLQLLFCPLFITFVYFILRNTYCISRFFFIGALLSKLLSTDRRNGSAKVFVGQRGQH